MTVPAFLFGSLVAVFLGVVFHLIKGGGPFYIFLYMLAGFIGFWVGHYVGDSLELNMWTIGPVHYASALLSTLAFLLITAWLFTRKPAENR
jgi:uncharacterized membrane protein YeaQ/YmgE (transglycosylase-associated protein family)